MASIISILEDYIRWPNRELAMPYTGKEIHQAAQDEFIQVNLVLEARLED